MSSERPTPDAAAVCKSGDAIFITDTAGLVQFASPSGERLIGMGSDKAAGSSIDTVFWSPGLFKRICAPTAGDEEGNSLTVVNSEGVKNAFAFHSSPLQDSSKRTTGYVVVLQDASNHESRSLVSHPKESHRYLESRILNTQKLESLGVMAGGIAHHFNNLLTGILGYSSLTLAELPPGSPHRWSIEQIEATAQRAAELTRQLLVYSGKANYHREAVDLTLILTEMNSLLDVMAQKVALRTNFAEPLPLVHGDMTQLRQVVTNLVTNAADALEDEMGTITIATGAVHLTADRIARLEIIGEELKAGHYVFLEVVDTGCGIDAEARAHVFDPFFTTKLTGRGLGLPATLGIVRAHGGAIEVSSEPGHGTTVRVFFPVISSPDGADIPSAGGLNSRESNRGTVLIVDDEDTVRGVLKLMLEKLGFDVLTAPDGLRGIEAFRTRKDEIVAVVLDKTMHHLSGAETLVQLRAIKSNVPVILSSGYSQEEIISGFRTEDLAGFLAKPYRLDALEQVLERIVPS